MSHYIPTMVPQWLVSSPVKIATLLEIADVGLSANRVHLNINQINSSSMSISFETWPEMVGIPHVHQLILNVGCIYPSYKPILSALIIKPLEQWSNPLSFHYKNGRTIMDYDSAQYYKGSIIPELMFKQHWFWTLILLEYMQCMMMCIYIYVYLIVPLISSLYYLHVPCFEQKHMSTHLQPFFERGSVTQRARVRALQDMEEAMTRLCVHVAWGKGPSCTFGRASQRV